MEIIFDSFFGSCSNLFSAARIHPLPRDHGTGIASVRDSSQSSGANGATPTADHSAYDLSGRRVLLPQKRTAGAAVYIVDGKKKAHKGKD